MEHNLCIACQHPIPVQNLTCANCRERPLPDDRPKPSLRLCLGLALFSLMVGAAAGLYGNSSTQISREIPAWVLGMSVSVPLALVLLLGYLIFFLLTHPEAE